MTRAGQVVVALLSLFHDSRRIIEHRHLPSPLLGSTLQNILLPESNSKCLAFLIQKRKNYSIRYLSA
jgi:hypothetical protein